MIYTLNRNLLFKSPQIEVCTREDIEEFLSQNKEFGLDTETSGMDPFNDNLICIAIGNCEDQYLIDTRYDDWDFLKPYLESSDWLKILANAAFDYKFLLKKGAVMNEVFDVITADLALNQDYQTYFNSLDKLLDQRLGIYISKDERSSFIGMTNEPLTDSQIFYATEDVKHLIPLKYDLENEAKEKGMHMLRLENAMSLVIADMEYEGVKVDVNKWMELAEIAETKRKEYVDLLDKEIYNDSKLHKFKAKYYQTNLFIDDEDIRKIDVKWTSPKQVLNVLQTIVPDIKSTESEEVQDYVGRHSLIKTYSKFQEWGKKSTTYGRDFLKHLNSDGRVRTEFFPVKSTGRMSSSKPNMQNIPKESIYRNCFVPNYDDWVFVTADFSSQELALIAYGAKDPVWLKALEEGKDLHSICAELLFGDKWKESAEPNCNFYKMDGENMRKQKCKCPKHEKLRDAVKALNFGLAFGLTGHSLSGRLGITLEEANRLIVDYFTTFPKVKGFLEALSYFAKSKGYMVTMPPFYRRRKFRNWKGSYTNDADMSSIERMGRNTHIQGTAADMIKLAMVYARKYINDNDLRDKVKIVLTVHDEINTITNKEYSETWKTQLKGIMEKAAQAIVPLGLIKADPTISQQWEK